MSSMVWTMINRNCKNTNWSSSLNETSGWFLKSLQPILGAWTCACRLWFWEWNFWERVFNMNIHFKYSRSLGEKTKWIFLIEAGFQRVFLCTDNVLETVFFCIYLHQTITSASIPLSALICENQFENINTDGNLPRPLHTTNLLWEPFAVKWTWRDHKEST